MSEEDQQEEQWQDLALGPLPVGAIFECLGLKLLEGEVMFYAHAQRHTFKDKPERKICIPHLQRVIANPTHVGQQQGYEADSIDLVCAIPGGPIVLAGISMRIKKGLYPLKSVYPLRAITLKNRVDKGTTILI
jgi:hypothetical protein